MKARMADKEVAKFVQILKNTRKDKGVSHEKLAALTGLSRTTIGAVESGRASPTLRTILRICAALKVRPSDILKQIGH